MIKQSFQKKKQITEPEKSDDFKKKKLQKKSSYDENNGEQNSKNVNFVVCSECLPQLLRSKSNKLTKKGSDCI